MKLLIFSLLLIACALILNGIAEKYGIYTQSMAEAMKDTVIVIDPGHGGEDGGAVGINGCIEKELNLEISLILNDLLQASGVKTVMTRTEDVMLYDQAIPGKKKLQDVKNRVTIAEEQENSLTVSIHMNTYPVSKYSGAQVYYSSNHKDSTYAAKLIQNNIAEQLQPQNNRETKAATSAIYLLHNVKTPAVLIECGFISNQEEAELLCSDSYRHKIACVIYTSIMEYLNKEV